MSKIKKIYTQSLPAMKLVGKCYHEDEKQNGTFAAKWAEWFAKDWFSPLLLPEAAGEPFEDCNAYIGLCRCKEGEPFAYWIGVFMPLDAPVPDGYESVEFKACEIAVCWIYGKEPEIYSTCCLDALKQQGYEWTADRDGIRWCFERYVCPRFTQPDRDGNVILDMCFSINFRAE